MATIKIYRIYDEVARPARHLATVVTDGKSASYVFPKRVEKSSNPKGLMRRAIERVGEAPDTPEGWAQILHDGIPMSSVKMSEAEGSVSTLTRSEQKMMKRPETPEPSISYAQGRDRELSDQIGLLMQEKPELSDFFENDDEDQDQPDAIRDYIRLVLEHEGAVDLNPALKEWLDGGEAPADFDGLVFFPETSSDKEE